MNFLLHLPRLWYFRGLLLEFISGKTHKSCYGLLGLPVVPHRYDGEATQLLIA